MEARGRKGEDEKGRRGPCATSGKALVMVGGGGREQRAGGRTDHGKQQQQTRSHVRAAGVGEGGWAGPGGREAEAQCALPGPPPTPAAAGRRGCGVNTQPNHKRAAPKGGRARQASLRPVGLSPGGGGGVCGFCPSFREQIAGKQQKASRHSASAPSQHRQRTSTEEETSELRFGAAHPHANVTTASAALTVASIEHEHTHAAPKFAEFVIGGEANR